MLNSNTATASTHLQVASPFEMKLIQRCSYPDVWGGRLIGVHFKRPHIGKRTIRHDLTVSQAT